MAKALIVVDVQNDFCEGGSLPVSGGAEAATRISEDLLGTAGTNYDLVVATKDWHIDPGDHFSETPDYADSWPAHCEVGTHGADFHPNLLNRPFDAIFKKGQQAAAYSGFEGAHEYGVDLLSYLNEHEITEVEVVGIAFDFCVRSTALDAVKNGLKTTVLKVYTASVSDETAEVAHRMMEESGVTII